MINFFRKTRKKLANENRKEKALELDILKEIKEELISDLKGATYSCSEGTEVSKENRGFKIPIQTVEKWHQLKREVFTQKPKNFKQKLLLLE